MLQLLRRDWAALRATPRDRLRIVHGYCVFTFGVVIPVGP
jgi:hypothetical protein